MRGVYEAVKTPYKYGVVLRPGEGESVDCPNVFRHGGRWYMLHVGIRNEIGYETRLAVSDNLRRLDADRHRAAAPRLRLGRLAGRRQPRPRRPGVGGLGRAPALGRPVLDVLLRGGGKQGYEPDPLGVAWTQTPTQAIRWTRLEQNPVLTPDQPDVRQFERATLYKSHVIWDRAESLRHPFVMYYNAKQERLDERIGMAVSRDMMHWWRTARGRDRPRQRHVRRSADRADRRGVGHVLFRSRLGAEGV